MNARGILAAAFTAAVVLALPSRAQEVNLAGLDEGPANRIHLRTGVEYGFVAGVGYSRAVPFAGRIVLLGGELTAPWAGLDVRDYRLRASALVPIATGQRWKLAGRLAPTLRGTDNDAGRMTSFGIDAGAVGGYYAPGWFAGGELGFDWTLATHVAHSDLYRSLVFADARDGWYANPGGNFRLGLQGGLSFSRYDLILRAGQLRDASWSKPLFPVYATLTLDARW